MDSAWALLQSNEFVFSTLYQELDVFPEVYGTCGGLFLVERVRRSQLTTKTRCEDERHSYCLQVEPLNIPGFWEKSSFSDFSHRVASALKILDLLEELDVVFDEPLLMCDVKSEHFGITAQGRIKVLDSDGVGLKSVVRK